MNSLLTARGRPGERYLSESSLPEGETVPLELAGCVLTALNRALPLACLILDDTGRCLWMNHKAALAGLGRDAREPGAPLAEIIEHVRGAALEGEALPHLYRSAGLGRITCQRLVVSVWPEPIVLVTIAPGRDLPDTETLCTQGLSLREAEVARLAVQGFSALNMAARLGVAECTVKTHLRRLYRKLKVCTRAELTTMLLDPERARRPRVDPRQ